MSKDELIDDYLKGHLSVEQNAEFEERMKEDNVFKKQIVLRKLIIEGIHEAYTEELKGKLIAHDLKLAEINRFSLNWRIAASVAFLVLCGIVTYTTFFKAEPDDFDIYEPGLPNAMGHSAQVQFNNAMSKFKAGDFKSAGIDFEILLFQNMSNDTLLYFSALCDFRIKNTDMAANKFERIESDSEFYDKALYRLAMAHWTKGRNKDARVLLEEVIATTKDQALKEEAVKALRAI
jgi:tetratricopeptide (TPR) repeat protein